MKEAKIILPIYPEALTMAEGTQLHFELVQKLASEFGGCTSHEADGAWVNDAGRLITERVRVHVVAIPETAADNLRLRTIARWVAGESWEDCVYCKTADGEVHLIEPGKLLS